MTHARGNGSGRLEALPAAGRIAEGYQRYLRSLIPITDDRIRAALHEQLATDSLVKGPFLEATPAYARGASPADLIAEGVLPEGFRALASPALPLERSLYAHQEQALRKAREGRNLVVATGTGSGKTESFLLPILAELAEQHERGELGTGVRSLLLYPMNALANDQMKRLRLVLAEVPWITFGRYTGETPNSTKEAVALFEQQFPGERRLPNELISREEMRATPPHILLTNYAMLEYLLLRPEDLELFDPTADTWRFLVVDEAHVYDGAKGTEVAMLLRRLRDRVASSRIQAIATSATVGSEDAAPQVAQFATNLFGMPFEWDSGGHARRDVVRATRVDAPGSTWTLAGHSFADISAAPRAAEATDPASTVPAGDVADPWLAGSASAGVTRVARTRTAEDQLLEAAGSAAEASAAATLAIESHVATLRDLLADGPRDVAGVAAELFGERADALAELSGLVDLASGLRDEQGNPVVSARYHLWANATDAAYVCLHPEAHHGYLREHRSCERCAAEGRPDVPVYQFAACQRCSTGYLQTPKVPGQTRTWLALGHPLAADDEDENEGSQAEVVGPVALWLCPGCGDLDSLGGPCTRCAIERVAVTALPEDLHRDPELPATVTPRRCVSCGGYTSGLIRGLSAGPEASTSVLATAAYQELPGDLPELPGEGRKLLSFSDSRQQAAYFAPYLQGGYSKILWRRILLEAVRGAWEANGNQPVPFDDVLARGMTLAGAHGVLNATTPLGRRREVATWLLAELCGVDERNSLEGTGLIRVTLDRAELAAPAPLLQAGFGLEEAWALIDQLLTTMRRAGALEFPEDLDIDGNHEAFGPRTPTWSFRPTNPEPRKHVASWSPQRGTNKRQSFVERALTAKDADPALAAGFLTGLWSWLSRATHLMVSRHSATKGVTFTQSLTALRFAPTGGTELRCDRCRRFATGTVAGVCPTLNCVGTLRPVALPAVEHDDDHFRRLYQTLDPAALAAKEHTAQLTTEEAASIQRDFVRGAINVLSCSTTFELGVDVGELQSVILRNVPPTTANYVQRAGRAGRRGTAAALVVTFARSRPHDQAMFREPLDMIAGSMRAPYVPIDNERIARRHVHSIAMSSFFRDAFSSRGLTWPTVESFFSPEISPSGPDLLAEYLGTDPSEVRASAAAVVPGELHAELGLARGAWRQGLVDQVIGLREEYRGERAVLIEAREGAAGQGRYSQAAVFDRTIRTLNERRLLDRLATRNVLPKYGFPVDVVEMKTYHLEGVGRRLELSRDLAVAIAEYSPGAQIVAGGRVIRSAGLARAAGKAWVRYQFGTCSGPVRHFEMRLDGEAFPEECPQCGSAIKPMRAIRPEFGFVADRGSDAIGDAPPRSARIEAAKVLRLAAEPQTRTVATQQGPIDLTWGKRAELAVISNGKGQGWWICSRCGAGQWAAGKAPTKHADPITGRECNGTMGRYRLVHTFETDALGIKLPNLAAAPSESVLAALLAGASDAFQIPIDDIGGTLHPEGAHTTLVIYDTVPAGAGNAIRMGERFEEVIAHAIARVSECSCGEDSSCYACLRHHRNQYVHEDLDRGAALAVLEGLV